MAFLIAYDIGHPRRLRRVARVLERRAVRCQYSVFLFRGTDADLRALLDELGALIRPAEDVVQAWPVPSGVPPEEYSRGAVRPVNPAAVVVAGGRPQFVLPRPEPPSPRRPRDHHRTQPGSPAPARRAAGRRRCPPDPGLPGHADGPAAGPRADALGRRPPHPHRRLGPGRGRRRGRHPRPRRRHLRPAPGRRRRVARRAGRGPVPPPVRPRRAAVGGHPQAEQARPDPPHRHPVRPRPGRPERPAAGPRTCVPADQLWVPPGSVRRGGTRRRGRRPVHPAGPRPRLPVRRLPRRSRLLPHGRAQRAAGRPRPARRRRRRPRPGPAGGGRRRGRRRPAVVAATVRARPGRAALPAVVQPRPPPPRRGCRPPRPGDPAGRPRAAVRRRPPPARPRPRPGQPGRRHPPHGPQGPVAAVQGRALACPGGRRGRVARGPPPAPPAGPARGDRVRVRRPGRKGHGDGRPAGRDDHAAQRQDRRRRVQPREVDRVRQRATAGLAAGVPVRRQRPGPVPPPRRRRVRPGRRAAQGGHRGGLGRGPPGALRPAAPRVPVVGGARRPPVGPVVAGPARAGGPDPPAGVVEGGARRRPGCEGGA